MVGLQGEGSGGNRAALSVRLRGAVTLRGNRAALSVRLRGAVTLSTRKVVLGQKIVSPALAARGTPLLALRVISVILGPPAPALEVGLFAAAVGWF